MHVFPALSFSAFLLLTLQARAQSLLPESPVSSSLASSVVAMPRALAFALNPAQSRADSAHSLHAAIAYTPFVGGLKDANQSAAEGTYYSSLIHSSFTACITDLSYGALYSDIAASIGFTKGFSLAGNRGASAGIRLRYESLSTTPAYPNLHFFIADLGFTIDLTPEATLGGTALNLLGANYTVTNGTTEKLDRRFILGIAYHPLAVPVKILTSVEENPGQPLSLQFGAEYYPVRFLALRLGTSTDTGNITTGIGILYSDISFDVGSRFDKALGSIFSVGASGAW
jgi:hypothetical protein